MKYLYPLLLVLFCCTCVPAQTVVSVEQQEEISGAILGLLLPISADYDLVTYKMLYTTTDALGRPDTASGMISVPQDTTVAFPLAIYNHGTVSDRENVPSRTGTTERLLVNAFATSGYITVAPDYIGLGDSDGIHPYVHAASEASAGRDLLLATRSWLRERGTPPNDQLFITGYSQGGHAAQALHRDLQLNPRNDSLTVTAASHLSGPYSISDVMREAALAEVQATVPGYLIYTYISYDYVYGLFDSLGQVFVAPYLEVIEDFAAEEIDGDEFNARLNTLLAGNSASLNDMFQDSIVTQLSSNDTTSQIIQALRANDTYEWAPESPTLIYYCTEDDQVPFRNALLADSVMTALGSDDVTLATGGALSHTGCVLPAAFATLAFFEQLAEVTSVNSGRAIAKPDLVLSPNPVRAGAELRITGLAAGGQNGFQLYVATGRRLQDGQLGYDHRVQLPGNLETGLHILRVSLPGGNFVTRRLVVRR